MKKIIIPFILFILIAASAGFYFWYDSYSVKTLRATEISLKNFVADFALTLKNVKQILL